MAKYTIFIKGNVQNANAFQGYFIGMSTPNTALSFAEHIKLNILKNLKESNFDGFDNYNIDHPHDSFDFITVKDLIYGFDGANFKLHDGHEKFVSAMKGNFDINPPIVDNKTFSSDFFVSFDLHLKKNIANFEPVILKDLIYNTVNLSKFSGGKIFYAYKDNIEVLTQQMLKDDFDGLDGLLKSKLKKGSSAWFLIEQFSELYLDKFNTLDDFKSLTDLEKILYVSRRAKNSNKKLQNNKVYDPILDGYYVPMTVGYRFLNKLQPAKDKFKYMNSYSEPLLGVVRCRSLDSFLSDPTFEVVWNNELHEDLILSKAKSIK